MNVRRFLPLFLLLALSATTARAGESLMTTQNRYDSPIHYRPKLGSVGDVIPFYWDGTYHIFYLHAAFPGLPWEHIFSRDLIHWNEAPTALLPDGAAGAPDAVGLGTGSIIEHDGTFHVYYTGFQGRQYILHATSQDLMKWNKCPADTFTGDEIHYKSSDFRDPFPFWNAATKSFWMFFCARDAKTDEPVQGVAESEDLAHWQQKPPLVCDPPQAVITAECPDLFRIGDTWYLLHSSWKKDAPAISGTFVRYAKNLRGPWLASPSPAIDTSVVYAAKSMSDGRRRVITGWVRDLEGEKDGGADRFGGDQCVPREIHEVAPGQLGFRPVPEALAQFPRVAGSLSTALPATAAAPDNYLLDASLQLDSDSEFTITLRRQSQPGSGYRLILRPAKHEAEMAGATFRFPRRVDLDCTRPIKLQIFVQGSIIECFLADTYAFTCRAYDDRSGSIAMKATGPAKIVSATIRIHD